MIDYRYFSMDHSNSNLKGLIFLAFIIRPTLAATYSLQYHYTAAHRINSTVLTDAVLDGVQLMYYVGNVTNIIAKNEWIRNVSSDGTCHRKMKEIQGRVQEIFSMFAPINLTEAVHTVQLMYGCELGDNKTKSGYVQFGYDGEDFISLDLNTLTWTAVNNPATVTKLKWEGDVDYALSRKTHLENTCIACLQEYVDLGNGTLERKVPPNVTLFQKDSSSPVVCHATGFFPRDVVITWKKNREDMHKDVVLNETSPNQDGTFQKRSILTVSPENLGKNEFTCVVQHSGLEKELELKVGDHRILNTGGGSFWCHHWSVIVGVVVAVLLLVFIGCVGLFIWRKKKKNNGFNPVSRDPNSALD